MSTLAVKATRDLSDEAAEGMAFAVKSGKKQAAEALFDAFPEDVVEEALDILRKLDLPSGQISDEAIRGLAVAVEAVGPGSPLVREFIEGTALDAAKHSLAFRNVARLRGIAGLDETIEFLRNNRNNSSGINGCIYEGTVARRLADGEQPALGVLDRVSHDGIPGFNTIDTRTSTHAIQVKHKTDPNGKFVPSDFASGYLDELAQQAFALQRIPALVTNRPINVQLQSELTTRGIQWFQMTD